MSNQFFCPRCNKSLNEQDPGQVQLKGILRGNDFTVSFPISLPSGLGEYGAKFPETIELKQGCMVEFHCPHCDFELTIREVPRHAFVLMADGSGDRFAVVFNRVFGEHSSFQFDLQKNQLLAAYGENQDHFREDFARDLNFFGC